MKHVKMLAALFCTVALGVPGLRAQSTVESRDFLTKAKDNSILYRSKQARRYNFLFNGTYYWTSPDFVKGEVVMDDKLYEDVLLNIDAYSQTVLVRSSANRIAVALDSDHIDRFSMGDTHFVNLTARGYSSIPAGFYEVLYDGDFTLYRHVTKVIVADLSPSSVGGKSYIYDNFETKESFYKEEDGAVSRIKARRVRRFLDGGPAPKTSSKALRNADYPVIATVEEDLVPSVPDSLSSTVSVGALPAEDFKVGEKTVYTSLPAGFFSPAQTRKDDALLQLINAGNEMVTFANKVYEIGNAENARGDRAYVRGSVRDVLTGEPLVGVAVYDQSGAYAMTDNGGSFQIRLPLGENTLGFSGYSLEDLHLNVLVHSDGGLDVVMKEKITALKGAVVSAESMVSHRDARMGIEKVRINTITKIPSAFGEADVLKVVLTLPGVKSAGEASSGFNVRGGSTDQNLVLFNDGTIYNPSHLFGIFSAFNTDVINDIELYKSSIPAEFGGRISSVLDVRGREGNSNKVQGSVGLGLLTSRFHVEGPIGEDHRTTFIVGGRTTYSNWLFNLLPASSAYAGGGASFSDLNASITHRINDRNTIQAYGYWSRDKFSFDGDTTFRYSNLNASIKWRSTLSDRTSMTVVGGYDSYSNIVDDAFNTVSAYSLATGVEQGFLKAGFKSVITEHHTVSYGVNSIYYDLNPGRMMPLGDSSLVAHHDLPRQRALESALYVSDLWQPTEKFSADLGVRYSAYNALEPSKFYGAPEFRISGKYSFLDNLSVKAGVNTMRQYIHLISNTSSVSPMDAWHLADADLKPQKGWQAATGLYWTLADNAVDLSLEGYYKRVSNYLDYASGAVLIMNENLADDLVPVFNKAYGVELMVKKPLGKLNGWLSYTYSRSLLREMHDRGVATINGGQWYCAPVDKPHDVKVVGNYKFTHRYSLSFNVDYSTGRPVTIPVSTYYYGGGMRLAYSARNGYRVPDYFRLDLALNIDPGHYLPKLTHMSWTFGVYNVTGRKNAYSIYYTTMGGTSISGYKISVFACPIPYLNLNLKFG